MYVRNSILLLLVIVFTAACTKKKDPVQQVMALKEMSELTTVEYVVTKIIKANDNKTWYKVGDRKILMSCKAHLTAGIDLSGINKQSVHIDGKNISLILPHSTLTAINIRPEDLKLEYEDVAFLREHYSVAERDALAVQGENQIRNSVEALGILQTAETNASLFISSFLHQLGYEDVKINFGSPDNNKN